jgi:hypothetical protein
MSKLSQAVQAVLDPLDAMTCQKTEKTLSTYDMPENRKEQSVTFLEYSLENRHLILMQENVMSFF